MTTGTARSADELALDAVYRAVARRCPANAGLILDSDVSGVPGEVLHDPGWLADRVADTGRRWNCPDERTAATLWWYSASAVLTGPGAAALLVTGQAPDPQPEALTLTLRTTGSIGYVERTRSNGLLAEGPGPFGVALAAAFGPTIALLAGLGGASARSLWAIAADSLAGRLLAASRDAVPGDERRRTETLAVRVAAATGGRMPIPRLDVAGVTQRPYVRRGSCCLIYQVPDHPEKCLSCPRQRPDERAERLVAWAATPTT